MFLHMGILFSHHYVEEPVFSPWIDFSLLVKNYLAVAVGFHFLNFFSAVLCLF